MDGGCPFVRYFDTHTTLYGERLGRMPQHFFTDKIYMTRENRRKLKDWALNVWESGLDIPIG